MDLKLTLVVLDGNTTWRKSPFEALGRLRSVALIKPIDLISFLKTRCSLKPKFLSESVFEFPIVLPPGWATIWNRFSCHRIIHAVDSFLRKRNSKIDGIVTTSPHYLPVIELCNQLNVPLYYYGSDDYSQYKGWGGEEVLEREAQLVRAAKHSFFVSKTLSERAANYPDVDERAISTCPNATSTQFLEDTSIEQLKYLKRAYPNLRHPIVGIVGAINDRLNFPLLRRCTQISTIGTLLFVGQTSKSWKNHQWNELIRHPKCMHIGRQPHDQIPSWMQLIDVALIPYADTPFNNACSPMRLFDHLASGKPVVSTNACSQCSDHDPFVTVSQSDDSFVNILEEVLSSSPQDKNIEQQKSYTQKNLTWHSRAVYIDGILSQEK